MPKNGLMVYKVLIASNVIANKKPKIFTTFVKILVGLSESISSRNQISSIYFSRKLFLTFMLKTRGLKENFILGSV